jgi:hypothetical protein
LADTVFEPNEEIALDNFGRPLRLAWGVLLLAFAVFCLICAATTLWTQFFFFQSAVQLDTSLQVGSGTIGVGEGTSEPRSENGIRFISSNTSIRTDQTNPLSQATITFRDPTFNSRLVAAVTLKGDTFATLSSARRPRFEFTSGVYEIDFTNVTGEVDVTVAENLRRDVVVSVNTPQGIEARILEAGRYVIESTVSSVSLVNRQGVAILIAGDAVPARSIPVGERGAVDVDTGELVIETGFINLLKNSSLQAFEADKSQVVADIANDIAIIGWSCSRDFQPQNRTPSGNYELGFSPDGRRSFRLVRTGASNNVATGCVQTLGKDVNDVTEYDELWLQVTFYVDAQSVSACGIVATECPMMMEIEFEDVNGNQRTWRHGVYAEIDPSIGWPLRCDTCRQDHYRIYSHRWYTYGSGNLFTVFPPEERPARVLEVSFYASGHNYDVYVNEVALLAKKSSETTFSETTSTDAG